MFLNTQAGGMNLGFPDVCKTPVPPVVVPIPYPNISNQPMANPGTASKKVLTMAMPSHNVMTEVPLSNGDQAGVAGGLISGVIMGATKVLVPSTGVMLEGKPASRLLGTTGQNGMPMNCPGTCLAPSQTKVLILK
jgi:hypothetical protein